MKKIIAFEFPGQRHVGFMTSKHRPIVSHNRNSASKQQWQSFDIKKSNMAHPRKIQVIVFSIYRYD